MRIIGFQLSCCCCFGLVLITLPTCDSRQITSIGLRTLISRFVFVGMSVTMVSCLSDDVMSKC